MHCKPAPMHSTTHALGGPQKAACSCSYRRSICVRKTARLAFRSAPRQASSRLPKVSIAASAIPPTQKPTIAEKPQPTQKPVVAEKPADPWKKVIETQNKGQALQGVIKAVNKGGVTVQVGSLRGFIPFSKLNPARLNAGQEGDMDYLMGQSVKAMVVSVDLSGPRRQVADASRLYFLCSFTIQRISKRLHAAFMTPACIPGTLGSWYCRRCRPSIPRRWPSSRRGTS